MTHTSSSISSWLRFGNIHFFDILIRIFLVFIPFSSFVSVFLVYKLGIPGASFIKELILLLAGIILLCTYFHSYITRGKLRLKFTKIDILIFVYISVMVGVSLFTTGIEGIIYGGRYDFAFLITFLIAYHGFPLLQKPVSYYLYLFLISGGIMLFLSALLKWPLTEDLLIFFGYSGNPSHWEIGGAPPIFHGIDGANVRRFQGILDNPNTMGAFLIIFSGIFAYFTRFRKEWYFIISIILLGIIGMVFYTYSRSALIGIVFAYMIVVVMSLRSLWGLYRMQLISVLVILAIIMSFVGIMYYDRATAIVGRSGSTKGHAERMMVGIERTIKYPIGQGLGSAGPAYRYVMNLENMSVTDVLDLERFYIPESWYIQQFIEGGIVGGILFLGLMLSFFISLILIHPILGAMFAGVGVMNLFLHTFESSIVSLTLFALMGILIAHKNAKK